MEFVKLESEKYLCQEIDQQIKQVKRYRNRRAVRDLVTFVVGVAIIPACMLLGQQLPEWFPEIATAIQTWSADFLPAQLATMLFGTFA